MRTTGKRERILLSVIIAFVVAWAAYSLLWSWVGRPLVGSKEKSLGRAVNANRMLPANETAPAQGEQSARKAEESKADATQLSKEKSKLGAYATLWRMVIFLVAAAVFAMTYRLCFQITASQPDDEGPLKGVRLGQSTRGAAAAARLRRQREGGSAAEARRPGEKSGTGKTAKSEKEE